MSSVRHALVDASAVPDVESERLGEGRRGADVTAADVSGSGARERRVGQDESDVERRRTLGKPGPVQVVGAAGLMNGGAADELETSLLADAALVRFLEGRVRRGGLLSVARAASNGDGGTLTCDEVRAMGEGAARLVGVGKSALL